MQRLLLTVLIAAVALPLAACQRTVSPEGYVSETPFEAYQRKIPTGYGGHRPVVLKPPVVVAPVIVGAEAPVAETYTPDPYAPVMAVPVAPVYAAQPLSAPVPVPVHPRSSVEWNDLSAYDGSLPATLAPQPVAPSAGAHTYSSPVLDNLMGQNIARPSALITREVDYGKDVTIYPLERADAPLPYIPPASVAQQAPVRAMKKQKTPTGYNQ